MASTDQRTASHSSSGAGADKSPPAKGEPGLNLKSPFTSDGPTGEEELSRTTSAPARERKDSSPTSGSMSPPGASDRRSSKEWDASKVPPSRFQKRKGSIFSTAGSRDSHGSQPDRDSSYHNKLKEKGWGEGKSPGLW